MSLPSVVDSLDSIPEALHEHYAESDGQYVLDHDGGDRVKEFRDNNITLRQENETLTANLDKYKGIDVEKYTELQTLERQKRDKELVESGDVETLINEKLETVKTDYEKRMADLNDALDKTRGELVATKVTDVLKTAAADAGVNPKALSDTVKLASDDWQLRDGSPVHVRDNEVVLSADTPGQPMGMGEYFKNMLNEKPYLFNGSSGAGGSDSTNAGGVRVIPNDPETLGRHAADIAAGKVVVEGSV